MKRNVWYCTCRSAYNDFFIIGDPRIRGAAVVFVKPCDGPARYQGPMIGVFEDYHRVSTIPKWVRPLLLDALIQGNKGDKG
jgi:hypothetical protein